MGILSNQNIWAGLIITFLALLWVVAMVGCAIKPEDINAWTNQARSDVLMLDGKMQRAINEARKSIASDVLNAVAKVDEKVAKANEKMDQMQANAKIASDSTKEIAKDGVLYLLGAGTGLSPLAYKRLRRNGNNDAG